MTKWKKFESNILNILVVILMVNLAEWLFVQNFISTDLKILVVFTCGSMSVFMMMIVDAIYEKHFGKEETD
ncbi:hypothetical protein BSK59_15990 [Paenibacillus odorifer]|uniref:hypothetical protein n=1 Tax=Paenibacillus odorifer TaxID=189426 RepID=UPI00096D755D|nr:hypothetical protein [Paenibacillus odorifer]OME54081.1 hypothetical protein BSK59_15990 [Paenibacillus odorifer]